jgi:Ni/Co efflux regulator RcnB
VKKRILILLTVVAFVVSGLAVTAAPAMAHEVPACKNSQGAAPDKNPHCQKDHDKKDKDKKDKDKKDKDKKDHDKKYY